MAAAWRESSSAYSATERNLGEPVREERALGDWGRHCFVIGAAVCALALSPERLDRRFADQGRKKQSGYDFFEWRD
jgi:hypothetical protein